MSARSCSFEAEALHEEAMIPTAFPNCDPPNGRKLRIRDPLTLTVRASVEYVLETTAKQANQWALFQKAKGIKGYTTAIESVSLASEKLFASP
jgi:hypothetical protein